MPRRSDFFQNSSWNLARMTNVWLSYYHIIGQASDIMLVVGVE